MQPHPLTEKDWVKTYEGKKFYGAYGSKEILIIEPSEGVQGPDIVPRRHFDLTQEDIKELERLKLPEDKWKNDAAILEAKYCTDEEYTMAQHGVVEGKKGMTKEYVLMRIESLMKQTTKQGGKKYLPR